MRLWHKDLIPVLPRKQLLGQWRECCLIAKNIAEKGTPNHILVNRVNGYPIEHLWKYGYLVSDEMEKRGYKCNYMKFDKWFDNSYNFETPTNENLFKNWHNERYLAICIANLCEKYDCGGISREEFEKMMGEFPSFEMIRAKGEWINPEQFNRAECSICSAKAHASFKFCPYCGADMRESRNAHD